MRIPYPFLLLTIGYTVAQAQSLYFQPLNGDTWKVLYPTSLSWYPEEIDNLLDYLEMENSKSFIVTRKDFRDRNTKMAAGLV